MSEAQIHTTEVATQYLAQVAADLERNSEEQARLTAELETTREQLKVLQRDHGVLVNIQQALTGSTQVAVAQRAVPRQVNVVSDSGEANGAAGGVNSEAPKKSATISSKGSGTTRPGAAARPTLVDLVHGHLEQAGEPRSAAEIASALAEAHPERAIKITVVRTTAENLVAKSRARRSKQGSSVFYTASIASQPGAVADS